MPDDLSVKSGYDKILASVDITITADPNAIPKLTAPAQDNFIVTDKKEKILIEVTGGPRFNFEQRPFIEKKDFEKVKKSDSKKEFGKNNKPDNSNGVFQRASSSAFLLASSSAFMRASSSNSAIASLRADATKLLAISSMFSVTSSGSI